MIKSIDYSQEEIIKNILELHCDGGNIDCDPTYSTGVFYKNIPRPKFTSDLYPKDKLTIRADAGNLPLHDNVVKILMFDPPFVISKGPSLLNKKEGRNMTTERFGCFGTPKELWDFYDRSLKEFSRVLEKNGTLIFKCQDTVSGGKNYFSHIQIIIKAIEHGFYPKDLFVLLAKNRLISGKIKKQQHARKFHSYFLVFKKESTKVIYG